MKKRIVNAKIACLDINLQKTRMQLGVQILVDDPDQLEDIRKRFGLYLSDSSSANIQDKERPKLHWNVSARYWLLVPMLF